ncbi:hypothetical protein Tco_0542536 [Tanacetum coccineum]
MDPYVTSTPNSTKLPILDTGKFEQWKFRIQHYSILKEQGKGLVACNGLREDMQKRRIMSAEIFAAGLP